MGDEWITIGPDRDTTKTPIEKWSEALIGVTIEGVWAERPGKFGPLVDFETSDGRRTFPMPTVLRRRLHETRPGCVVRVTYLGLDQGADGTREFHNFKTQCKAVDRLTEDGTRTAMTTRTVVARVQANDDPLLAHDREVDF